MKGAKVGGWGNFFTEGNKGNEAGTLLFSSNGSPITRHGISTIDPG